MLEIIMEAMSILLSRIPSRFDQQSRKIRLCRQLKTLHGHLKQIIDDGTALSELLSENRRYLDGSPKSSELLSLLRQQSSNINKAQQTLEELQEAMQIKFPEITERLRFYLPLKGNVINVFASAEEEANYKKAVNHLGLPVYKYTQSVEELAIFLKKHSREGELFLSYSQDPFDQLKSYVDKLREAIDKTCTFDELI